MNIFDYLDDFKLQIIKIIQLDEYKIFVLNDKNSYFTIDNEIKFGIKSKINKQDILSKIDFEKLQKQLNTAKYINSILEQ